MLLCSALAGCGSVVASTTQAGAPGTPAAKTSAAGTPAAGAASAVGCASVNQATSVAINRTMHLVEPTRAGVYSKTQDNPALVRALFGDLCNVVAHPYTLKGAVPCPAEFGIGYTGTFYEGTRPLAKFVYGASGCRTVSVTADGKTRSTVVMGTAAGAAPKLATDMAAVLGLPASQLAQPTGAPVNPGGPNKPLR